MQRRSSNSIIDPNEKPMWINPCGIDSEHQLPNDMDYQKLSDADLIQQIIAEAKLALSAARSFSDEYVMKTFNVNFEQHHQDWKDVKYDWLPTIPKKLGEKTPEHHLKSLQLDSSLTETYEYLQRLAVGLEQVIYDMAEEEKLQKSSSSFIDHFEKAWYKLKAVLCEIQVAIIERNVKPKENIPRSIMSDEFRKNQDATFRNMRDWVIFRDYMNTLEYIIETFQHIQNRNV